MQASLETPSKTTHFVSSSNALTVEPSTSQRLYSLDALRGFDMFWIMGAEEVFHELSKITGSPFWGAISNQFTHPDWNGFHVYDLIFPLFPANTSHIEGLLPSTSAAPSFCADAMETPQ